MAREKSKTGKGKPSSLSAEFVVDSDEEIANSRPLTSDRNSIRLNGSTSVKALSSRQVNSLKRPRDSHKDAPSTPREPFTPGTGEFDISITKPASGFGESGDQGVESLERARNRLTASSAAALANRKPSQGQPGNHFASSDAETGLYPATQRAGDNRRTPTRAERGKPSATKHRTEAHHNSAESEASGSSSG